jgi:hypothetical protein
MRTLIAGCEIVLITGSEQKWREKRGFKYTYFLVIKLALLCYGIVRTIMLIKTFICVVIK